MFILRLREFFLSLNLKHATLKTNLCHSLFHTHYLQFKDEHHLVLVLEGVVEVDQFAVVQVVHDVDLLPDQGLW